MDFLLQRVHIPRHAKRCTIARAIPSVLSVCLSVCPSHSGIMSSRMKIRLCGFQHYGRTIHLVSEEAKFIRIFAGDHPRWIDHISNATVSSHTGLASVGEQTASRRVAIFHHIARLSEEVPAHQALRAHVDLSPAWSGLEASSWSTKQQMDRSGS